MSVLSFAFCKDHQGNFGLIKSYKSGYLTVVFDYGVVEVKPTEVIFI